MKKKKTQTMVKTTYYQVAWIFFALFALLFIMSPYQRGLFFHTDFFSVGMGVQALFLLSLPLMLPVVRDLLREQWTILIIVFAIPLVYAITFWYSYSPSMASYEALQWFAYALTFFLLLMWMTAEERIREALWLLAWATMLWITGLVFLVHFGLLEYQDAILGGSRFSSVFQYPNTFAALLSVFVLVGLQHLTKRLSWGYASLYAFTLFPFFLAFLLTQSRGALLVFVAAWVFALYFLSWREQVLYVIYSAVLVLVGFWGYSQYTEWMQEEIVGRSVMLLVSISVVLGFLFLGVQYLLVQRKLLTANNKWGFLAPLILTVTGALTVLLAGSKLRDKVVELFPEGLQRRVESISLEEAYSRLLFFKDALVVWRDHFFFGTGGGGWRALFESYKSLPYYSTQAHSFYMQTLVELGMVGSLIVFGFLFYVVVKGMWFYFRKQVKNKTEQLTGEERLCKELLQKRVFLSSAIMGAVILLMHSAIDFNMSFGTYNLFLFLFLALIWHDVKKEPWLRTKFYSAFHNVQEMLSGKQKAVISYVFLGLLTLCSLFAGYTSYAYSQAERVQGLINQRGELPELLAQVDRAIAHNNHDVRYKQLKLSVLGHAYQQTEDQAWLEQMKEVHGEIVAKEPTVYQHYLQYAQFLWDIEEKEEAMEMKMKALTVAPWQQSIYEDILASGLAYIEEKEFEDLQLQQDELLRELYQVIKQYEARIDQQVEDAPEGFTLSNRIRRNYDQQLRIAQLYLYQEEYTSALEALRVIIPESQQEQDWFLDMFVQSEGKQQVKPFELRTLWDDLEQYLDEEHVIILAGRDRVARRLSQPVKDLLARTGSKIADLGNNDSYVGVIIYGKMVAESMNAEKPIEINSETHSELSKLLGEQQFSFYSAGHGLGDESSIVWKGEDYSRNSQGLNIVVLNKDGKVVERIHYNTHIWDYKIIVQDERK